MDNRTLFNSLLYNNRSVENDNTCLISSEDLDNNSIKLQCGHAFNYISIYNEVVNQKTKKIGSDRYLKLNEIKCPYCRKISTGYLPFYKYYGIKNYPLFLKNNITFNLQQNKCLCDYINTKNIKCNNLACNTKHGNFCNKHLKYTNEEEELINNIMVDNEKY